MAPGSGGVLAVGDDGQIYLDGQSLVQLAAKGIPWKSVAFGGNVLFTLSRDGRAYEHGRGLYGEAKSLLIPFPASVTEWVRMKGVPE